VIFFLSKRAERYCWGVLQNNRQIGRKVVDWLKKSFVVLLAFFMLSLYFPSMGFAEKQLFSAKSGITKHRPQVVSTPEQDIPTVKEKKTRLWPCCVGLGLLAIAGAAAGGGGGDDGNGNGTTGNIGVTW
jgi:hypothetical protein